MTSTEPVDEPGKRKQPPKTRNARKPNVSGHFHQWRGQDLNLRPSGYERTIAAYLVEGFWPAQDAFRVDPRSPLVTAVYRCVGTSMVHSSALPGGQGAVPHDEQRRPRRVRNVDAVERGWSNGSRWLRNVDLPAGQVESLARSSTSLSSETDGMWRGTSRPRPDPRPVRVLAIDQERWRT